MEKAKQRLMERLYEEFTLEIHPSCINELEQLAKLREYCKLHISLELTFLYDVDNIIDGNDLNDVIENIMFYSKKIIDINRKINDYFTDDIEA